jgi:hypothetical protein
MNNSQLYKFVETSRLNELDRSVAIAAIRKGELFASAVMWLMSGVRKLGS